MSEFLTRRNGTWHFVRRVPLEFAEIDRRVIIRHSTRIRIAHDRAGRRAARARAGVTRYEDARKRARLMGYEYLENAVLIERPSEARLERLEALVAKGVVNDPAARAALLGTEKRSAFNLSKLFDEYEAATKDELRDYSPEQLRIWRNGRVRAVENLVSVVGDKLVTEISTDDAIDYTEWWRERVLNDGMVAKSANKDIGQLSRMLKEMSIRRRLNLPDIFKGLRLKGETERPRCPYEVDYIQTRLLDQGGLLGLNEDARYVMYVIMETGLRPSEVVNLTPASIQLDAAVPHVKIRAEDRRLKTDDSEREIPLVGAALDAMRLRPDVQRHATWTPDRRPILTPRSREPIGC